MTARPGLSAQELSAALYGITAQWRNEAVKVCIKNPEAAAVYLRCLEEVRGALQATADPADEKTWHLPCWNCGHVPGCAWVEGCGYAACPECFAD